MSRSRADRFWEKVRQDGACWVWTGALQPGGYGYFSVGEGRYTGAHRWAYEFLVAPIPDGLVIDHLCRNRKCVNPYHLEPVPQRVNVARGIGVGRPRMSTCRKGHDLTPENVETRKGGGRRCITCRRARENECKRNRREVRAA